MTNLWESFSIQLNDLSNLSQDLEDFVNFIDRMIKFILKIDDVNDDNFNVLLSTIEKADKIFLQNQETFEDKFQREGKYTGVRIRKIMDNMKNFGGLKGMLYHVLDPEYFKVMPFKEFNSNDHQNREVWISHPCLIVHEKFIKKLIENT
jgi:signal recognition particle GTPase